MAANDAHHRHHGEWFRKHVAEEIDAALDAAKATPEQRKQFIDAFYRSLLTNYGSALTDFTAERLKIFPTKVEGDTANLGDTTTLADPAVVDDLVKNRAGAKAPA